MPSEVRSAISSAGVEDRAIGSLIGLAVGDAVGTTLEFMPRDACPPLTDMTGGGPFRLEAGQWTDDTAMALALADSLVHKNGLDEQDLLARFSNWREWGVYSCTGACFDIGVTTRNALDRWRATGNGRSGSDDPRSAGNGSLMRLAPVAIRFWRDRGALRDAAARQSMTTHAAPEAVGACIAFAEALADAIEGNNKNEVLRARPGPYAGAVSAIAAGGWRGKNRDDIRSSGYVVHTLEAALWCFDRTSTYRDAVLLAANLGVDADTTAAVTGQLAGAFYGAAGIPEEWTGRVAWKERIVELAAALSRAA